MRHMPKRQHEMAIVVVLETDRRAQKWVLFLSMPMVIAMSSGALVVHAGRATRFCSSAVT